ncbi:hypothetical protein NQ176_g272 [Zarea fungicola]|uniref:Uncharacterized protein n=1 Tax=Zarea fungicola TaxID=93591 RepID=A0ACC1NYP5_9HYPO|nr:hypothetical protein NQ176_g272 [Lecanicillium fungicola]
MENNRAIVIHALRAARESAAELLDVQQHQCYDRAFLQLATHLIAEAEIIIAHCQDESTKARVRRLQKGLEETRSGYPSSIGAIMVWMSADEDSIPENLPLEVARLLDVYRKTLKILSDSKEAFCDILFSMGTAMVHEETTQNEQELIALLGKLSAIIKEDERLLQTGESRSECFEDQIQAAMNRSKQVMARMVEIEAARKQPESLIQLMFY